MAMQETTITHGTQNTQSAASEQKGWRESWRIIKVLFKLRIVFLLLMSATGGAFLAAGGWPGIGSILLLWVTGGMAASGASAINQYWERHSDGKMGRTEKRPLVNGDITNPHWIPYVGIFLILTPSLAVLPFNLALTFFLLLGAFIYVVIYTIWLKPLTLLNIVIGGAAGSAAVMSGSAAVGNWSHPGAVVLALLLFLWTPFHFWSLAILYRDDYARNDVPMLPVTTTPRKAAWWVMSHTSPTALGGLLLVTIPELGWVYFLPVMLITIYLVRHNIRLIIDPAPDRARALFMASNFYLLVLILAICIGTMVVSWAT